MNIYSKVNLDARLTGSELLTAPANTTTTFRFTFPFDVLMNGLELYAFDSTKGDQLTMLTEYPIGGGSYNRYKKFAKMLNVFPNVLQRYVLFPTEPKAGIVLRIDYKNVSATEPANFSYNIFQFCDTALVNPAMGEQGMDW